MYELIDMIEQRVHVSVSVTSLSVRASGRIAMIKLSKGIVRNVTKMITYKSLASEKTV